MRKSQEIISFVKKRRGERGEFRKRHFPDLNLSNLNGQCVSVVEVADTFGGAHWRSELCQSPPGAYPGHSLAVIPTRGKAGVIVEYTNTQAIIIGSVPNVHNQKQVSIILEQITGWGGWKKK